MTIQLGKISVGEISTALNGGKQVELRQIITRSYDDSNNLADALFVGLGNSYNETRVAWRAVPEKATKDIVKEQLDEFPEACLRKILSHEIIVNDGQDRVYKNGFTGINGEKAFADFKEKTGIKSTTWDDACRKAFLAIITEAQLVKYGEGSTEGTPGTPILFNGKKQYKVIVFSQTAKKDIDLRIEKAVTQSIVLAPMSEKKEEIEA